MKIYGPRCSMIDYVIALAARGRTGRASSSHASVAGIRTLIRSARTEEEIVTGSSGRRDFNGTGRRRRLRSGLVERFISSLCPARVTCVHSLIHLPGAIDGGARNQCAFINRNASILSEWFRYECPFSLETRRSGYGPTSGNRRKIVNLSPLFSARPAPRSFWRISWRLANVQRGRVMNDRQPLAVAKRV